MAEIASLDAENKCFSVYIDVQQFELDEIQVKLVNEDTVIVEGKHNERPDKHGFISRFFRRRYLLPLECDARRLRGLLSTDGILQVIAPRKDKLENVSGTLNIPILTTGREFPLKTLMKNKKGDDDDVNSE